MIRRSTPFLPILLVVLLAVAGCGGEVAWPKAAGDTSCQEWTSQMSEVQRSAMGTAMLLVLRANDGGTVRPKDGVIGSFIDAVGHVCATTPDEKVSSVAATIYLLSDALHP